MKDKYIKGEYPMTEKEKLEKEIKDAKSKLEELEKKAKTDTRSLAVKSLDEYTDKEKIKFFDKLYKSALSELSELEEKGWSDEDNATYAWEEYIQILAKDRESFWKYWRSLSE